ncbi:hypothetical protein ACA910_012800 [Epithemia clementina (nom. ined.)]
MSSRIFHSFSTSLIRLSSRDAASLCRAQPTKTFSVVARSFAATAGPQPDFPDSLKRVGNSTAFPDESPGCIYEFNWCLNGDGVTPLRRSAFRITKPLDLKLAGLAVPKKMPLSVKAADASKIPEAGGEKLSFETFDEVSQRSRDLLSLSDHLYCPEGHVPGTRTAVRVITNSGKLAPDLLAYFERAPKKDPPESLPITVYALEGTEESFAGYAIEEVEVPIPNKEAEERGWYPSSVEDDREKVARSVASIVVVGQTLDIKTIVAGIELSQKALAADEVEREAKKEAEAKSKE